MNKNDLKYYISNVILYGNLFLMGIIGDKFIQVIILLITSIVGVIDINQISIRKYGVIR